MRSTSFKGLTRCIFQSSVEAVKAEKSGILLPPLIATPDGRRCGKAFETRRSRANAGALNPYAANNSAAKCMVNT